MPDDLFRKAKALAAVRGQSMKQWLTDLLQKEIGETSMAGETAPGKEKKEKKAKADAFKRELDALATQVTKSWQGPQDAVAAIREQRRG
ncbi:MAG: hypothetical protein ABIP64_18125 [Burkholderiales bacterium]